MAKVSNVRKSDKVVAILCSDIHLSHKPPIARSAEPDWYEAMRWPLDQLRDLQEKYDCPTIIAGDIFDKWDSPAELINFALNFLPMGAYAIPGQHDLPNHNLEDIERSAYWTLVAAGTIKHLDTTTPVGDLTLWPAPWGEDIPEPDEQIFNLAVVHAYIWQQGYGYPGAPKDKYTSKYVPKLKGYQAAAFGDNHKGFQFVIDNDDPQNGPYCSVINCGTLMRRKADEMKYQPHVGVLYANGNIRPHFLHCKDDKFVDIDQALELVERSLDITEFVGELAGLARTVVDFGEALRRFLTSNKIDSHVRKVILDAMERK